MEPTRGASKEHFIQATVESLACQVYDLLEAMQKDSGVKLHALEVDSGAFVSNFLMQFQSDTLDTAVIRPRRIEITVLDATYPAGLAVGYWKDREDIRKNRKINQRFYSEITTERRAELVKGQKWAVRCALFWAENENGDEVQTEEAKKDFM